MQPATSAPLVMLPHETAPAPFELLYRPVDRQNMLR